MTRLLEALRTLGLEGEVDLGGRWVKVQGERCPEYLAGLLFYQVLATTRSLSWWCARCPPCTRMTQGGSSARLFGQNVVVEESLS